MKFAPPIEQFIESLFVGQGGKVIRTEYPKDPVVLLKMVAMTQDNCRCLVTCVHSLFPIGEDYIQSLYREMSLENADRAVLVATGPVTSEARELARSFPIQILDGYDYWAANRQGDDPEVCSPEQGRALSAAQLLENGFVRLVGYRDPDGDFADLMGKSTTLDIQPDRIELWSPWGIHNIFETEVVGMSWKSGSPLGTDCSKVAVLTLEYIQHSRGIKVSLEFETKEELAQAYICALLRTVLRQNNAPKSAASASKQCFVASAVYENVDCPQVIELRHWRDTVLATNTFGRFFIRTYYRCGWSTARFIERRPILKNWARRIMDRFVMRLAANRRKRIP